MAALISREPVEGDARSNAVAQLGADLESLAAFSTQGAGVTRIAWTEEYRAGCEWLTRRMTEEGLSATVDPAGNVVGELPLAENVGSSKAVVVGSHIDTVPAGGKFDGSLGVLAGLCVARALASSNRSSRGPYWLVAFMDEEGVRFGTPLFGSRAFAGEVPPAFDRVDKGGWSIADALKTWDRKPGDLGRAKRTDEVGAYLELHIEQGPILADGGLDLGVVTDIMGRRLFDVHFCGEANHAGTTPRAQRRDALKGAAEFTVRLHDAFDRDLQGTVNVGAIDVKNGAVNVVPGTAVCHVELRAATVSALDVAEEALRGLAREAMQASNLAGNVDLIDGSDPVMFNRNLVALIERIAIGKGASVTRLISGAGHDAMTMATHVPAAMLMVPSRNGISHSPAEDTDMYQCELGAEVLIDVVQELLATGTEELICA